jgi:CHAT domain-containing protein
LLSYWVLGEEGTLAFLITDDEFTVVELLDATPDNLDTALSGLYDWLNKDNPHPKPLQDLHSWLVAPLAEHLQTPKVGLIPHQELHEVPFAALTDGERYFGEQYTLFRQPSASVLSHIEKNAATLALATQPALIFGNPITGEDLFPPLVHAAKEAAKVADLLGAPVYAEGEAHEARLSSASVGAPVVHLAAHASYNSLNPLYSAIHLAPQDEYDGRLETHEVYSLDLSSAEMVILSACQSNVGDLSGGDDIVGLTRAFFFAGTPTLVSSLWNVDDAATEALMSAFYRNWQGGMGKAAALPAAQAEVRANPKWASPFFWAAFVLNGDAGEVSRQGEERSAPSARGLLGLPWMAIAGIAGLLVLVVLVMLVIARRRIER